MTSPKRTLLHFAVYIAAGFLLVGIGLVMAVNDVSDEVAKEFIWTTVSAIVVLGTSMPMFWGFRSQPGFWVVSLAVLAVHTATYLILLPRVTGLSIVVLGLFLPLEAALVHLAFHKALRRDARPSPGQRT